MAKIGRPLADVDAAIRIVVAIDEVPAGYAARIWWVVPGQPIGARRFDAAQCSTVSDAAAEMAALAATPAIAQLQAETAPPPSAPDCPTPEAEPTPTPAPESTPPPRKRRRLRGGVAALAGVGLGETPQAAGVARARLSLIGRRFRVGAQGHYRFVRRADLHGGEGGVRVSGWAVGPRGCTVPRLGPVEFPVCVEVMVGQLLGRPFGLRDERRSQSLWANAGLGVGAWWPATKHIAIGADALGFVAFRRPAFDTSEGTEIVRAAPAGFAVVAGVEARFGGAP